MLTWETRIPWSSMSIDSSAERRSTSSRNIDRHAEIEEHVFPSVGHHSGCSRRGERQQQTSRWYKCGHSSSVSYCGGRKSFFSLRYWCESVRFGFRRVLAFACISFFVSDVFINMSNFLDDRSTDISQSRLFAQAEVIDLMASNFDAELAKGGKWIIMFHVNWCKICTRTFPLFQEASDMPLRNATEAGVTYEAVNYAHVDCTDDKTLTNRFEIKGYPSILYWDDSLDATDYKEFRGSRSAPGFHAYTSKMGQRPHVLPGKTTWDAEQQELRMESLVSYAYVTGSSGGKVPAWYEKFATKKRDLHKFYKIEKGWVEDMKEPGAYILASEYMAHQLEIRKYTGDGEDFEQWALRNRFPGIWRVGDNNFYDFTHTQQPALLLVVDVNVTESAFLEKAVEVFGTESERGVNLGLVDGNNWKDALKDFGIFPDNLPRIWIVMNNFDSWYEDKELLAFKDLYKIVEGHEVSKGGNATAALFDYIRKQAPFLYLQDRGYISKGLLYVRGALWMANEYRAYAQTGNKEMMITVGLFCGVIAVGVSAILIIWWILKAVWDALWEEDLKPEEIEEQARMIASQQQKKTD